METEPFILRQNDWLPNNERLPVLLYRRVVKAEGRRPRNASNGCSPNMAVIALPDHRLRRLTSASASPDPRGGAPVLRAR